MANGLPLRVLFTCIVFLLPGSLKSNFRLALNEALPPTSSANANLFPCIQSWVLRSHQERVAVLHGPDWALESSVRPSCFPEREVVFVTEVGRGIMPHPITAKIRMWVTKDHDVMHIRIVDSSASSREQEMVAVGFVTNHKCCDRKSEHYSVKGGAAFVRID